MRGVVWMSLRKLACLDWLKGPMCRRGRLVRKREGHPTSMRTSMRLG